ASHRRCQILPLIMPTWWVFLSQLTIAFTLAATAATGNPAAAGPVLFTNGLIATTGAGLIHRLLPGSAQSRQLALGFAIAGTSFALVPLLPSLGWILACVALFTVGEMITTPTAHL